ncbi:hypothetical protein BU23DRAFT_67334 [Bimuria novae-zelandiae CBS 107.79]|uniref:Secreted protein n=1 Tax=Bimuria novae-zelandiae CBS 107.79 TaxID=1447943 RepID=A0A6A5VH84_9PLEO|nr:hypothetical protein BU23DRAFT_67334 [Bimuria novae-zelandiae CBS 107.79]
MSQLLFATVVVALVSPPRLAGSWPKLSVTAALCSMEPCSEPWSTALRVIIAAVVYAVRSNEFKVECVVHKKAATESRLRHCHTQCTSTGLDRRAHCKTEVTNTTSK